MHAYQFPILPDVTGQYAIWAVFDPAALNDLSGVNLTNAAAWRNYAQSSVNYSAMSFSNIYLHPDGGVAELPNNPPQEFLVVNTPEAPAVMLLGVDLSAIGKVVLLVRRRKQKSV